MKLDDGSLRSLKLLSASLLLCLILSGCGDTGNQDKLYWQVQELAAQSDGIGSFDVALSDLTDFDWEEAVVFKHPASGEEMEEAIGVKYQGALDLTCGIFFVNDKEIVYEELFPKDFETRPSFMIHPHSGDNIGDKPHFGVFTPDSVFMCTITEADQYSACYTLKPVHSSGDGPE